MRRLFVAIDLPEGLEAALETLRDPDPGARWTRPGQHHLTLKFIGAASDEQLTEIVPCLEAIRGAAFPVALDGVDVFPSPNRARVLVAMVRPQPELSRLHAAVEASLAELGFEPEARPFRPHLTIGRFKEADPGKVRAYLSQHAGFRAGPFLAKHFHLYESRLHPAGAVYTRLATYGLIPVL